MNLGSIVTVPFSAVLRFFYNLTGSYAWALVLFTVAIKLILLPFQLKSKKSMLRMNRLNPKVQELQKKYAENKEKLNEETAKLYQEEGINPMSGCIWTLIPFPILIALYAIIRKPLSSFMNIASEKVEEIIALITNSGYTFVNPDAYKEIEVAKYVFNHFDQFKEYVSDGLIALDYNFLGIDLAAIPSQYLKEITTGGWPVLGLIIIAVLAGVTGLLFSIVSMKSSGQQPQGNNKLMVYLMPLMTAYIAFIMPAALGIYWIANNVVSMVQDILLNKVFNKKIDAEEEERIAKKEAARKFRQEEGRRLQEELKANGGKEKKAEKKADKKDEPAQKVEKNSTTENGRVGDRPYARGRAYKEERYKD